MHRPTDRQSTETKVGGILLAAGASARLGRAKQLLEYKGEKLLDRTVGFFKECLPTDRIILVYGARKEEMIPYLEQLPIRSAYNPGWETGMGSSVRTGLKTLLSCEPELEAILLALIDQPLVTSKHFSEMIDLYQSHPGSVIATRHGDDFGVPALLPKVTFPDLLSQKGITGAKKVIKKYSDLLIPYSCPEAAFDIDTEADYQRLLTL